MNQLPQILFDFIECEKVGYLFRFDSMLKMQFYFALFNVVFLLSLCHFCRNKHTTLATTSYKAASILALYYLVVQNFFGMLLILSQIGKFSILHLFEVFQLLMLYIVMIFCTTLKEDYEELSELDDSREFDDIRDKWFTDFTY